MSAMAESLLFIQALAAHTDRLQDLLGDDWPTFQTQLQQWLAELAKVEDDTQTLMVVDEILELGLKSSAAQLIRPLFHQAATKAGSLDSATRSVRMTDPTSGQTREVEARPEGKATPEGETLSVGRADVVAAGRALSEVLLAGEVHIGAKGTPEPRYFNALFTEPDGQTAVPPDEPLVE